MIFVPFDLGMNGKSAILLLGTIQVRTVHYACIMNFAGRGKVKKNSEM